MSGQGETGGKGWLAVLCSVYAISPEAHDPPHSSHAIISKNGVHVYSDNIIIIIMDKNIVMIILNATQSPSSVGKLISGKDILCAGSL